jgi:hypothetical protein
MAEVRFEVGGSGDAVSMAEAVNTVHTTNCMVQRVIGCERWWKGSWAGLLKYMWVGVFML